MKNSHKALKAIEYLVGNDFGMEMECLLHPKLTRKLKKKNAIEMLKTAAQIITDVYIIAHAEGHCAGHPQWQDKKYKILANNF